MIKAFIICLLISFAQSADVYKTIVISKRIFNPNGYPRQVISVQEEGVPQDFPFPGPLLRAVKGDVMHITYKNHLDTSTSIHCHGIHMHENPWMDGVTGITECGIPPGNSFTYSFNLTQTGTYWYHDHSATMYGDGLFGPIIIDYPPTETDPVRIDYPYEKDYVLMMQDWMHESTSDLMSYYKGPYGSYPGFQPKYPWPTTSLLLNGRGSFDCTWDDCSWLNDRNMTNICESLPQCIPVRPPLFGKCVSDAHPMQEFACPAGENVRLRLINAATNLALHFWIDRHSLTIVARDGVEVKYVTVENVTVAIAQRIDVIVKCDQDPNYRYIMKIAPSSILTDLKNISASAVLVYGNATQVRAPLSTARFHSDVYFEYQHLVPKVEVVSPPAIERFVIDYRDSWTTKPGFPLEEWLVNNVSFIYPSQPLLPAYYQGVPISELVQTAVGSNNMRKTIIQPLVHNQVYEIVMIGNHLTAHPWHIHGHYLDFLEAGSIRPFIETNFTDECNQTLYDQSGVSKLLESLTSYDQPRTAIGKGDSFMVPGFGYVVFRFKADNVGPWMFHCHIEWHMAMGMAMLFSVESSPGEYDIMPPPGGMSETCVPTTVLVATADEGGSQYGLVIATSLLGFFLLIAMPFAGYGAYALKQNLARKYGLLK